MTPKIVKVERTQYFDYRPFTPSFMLVNQLEEEARRQERIQEEKEIKENRNNRGLFNFLLLPKRRRNEKWYEGYRAGAYDAIELCKHYFVGESIGRKARIISCSLRNKNFPIAAIVEDEEENVYQFEANGVCDEHDENLDLMMLPEKRSGWINVKKDAGLFKSREEAERNCTEDYVPVMVEFEI